VYAFTNTPVVLECQGSNAVTVEVTSNSFNANLSIYTENIFTFKFGPTMSKHIEIRNINSEISIQCFDSAYNKHEWKIIPPLLKGIIIKKFILQSRITEFKYLILNISKQL